MHQGLHLAQPGLEDLPCCVGEPRPIDGRIGPQHGRVKARCPEFVRMPDNGVYVAFDWLTRGQILSLPLIVLGLVLLAMSRRAPVLQPVLPLEEKKA